MTTYKTLAEVRKSHHGYWFTNHKRGQEGFIGNLRRRKFFITWEKEEIGGFNSTQYKIWGVYQNGDIKHLASFSSRELCLAEVNNNDPRGMIESKYTEGYRHD
jgi:hypothetical protein